MNSLRKQFEKEGNCYEYNGQYTEWLEKKCKEYRDVLEWYADNADDKYCSAHKDWLPNKAREVLKKN